MQYVWKFVSSIICIWLYGVVNTALHPLNIIMSADAAGDQFSASDFGYIRSVMEMNFFQNMGIPFLVLVAILLFIWIPSSIFKKKESSTSAIVGIILGMSMIHSQDANAYYDTANKTEAYTILPNESAFWIPDVGNNVDSQRKFDSEQYLEKNKIAAKRFIIPHHKLDGSGGMGFDAYVPDGRLIIVDRTTYSREWVGGTGRGSSSRDDSFPCQSNDGINIKAGVSIGASVHEENAAKYLYNFGVRNQIGQDRTSKEVIFQSVYYGRSLAEVMDDVGRKKVQTLVCSEIAKRSFDDANRDTNPIIDSVNKSATEYFESVGITINFIGWADTFEFDKDVQKAVNDRYIAKTITPALPVLQALADIRVKEGVGEGIKIHGLPAQLIAMPDNQLGGLGLGAVFNTLNKTETPVVQGKK